MNNKQENDNHITQMRKGMLEYCVLLALQHGEAYAPDIINILKAADMIVVEGTLYTLLNRLKREEKLDYFWQESAKGAPRKYYRLTSKGTETLKILTEAWDNLSATIKFLRNPNNIKALPEF